MPGRPGYLFLAGDPLYSMLWCARTMEISGNRRLSYAVRPVIYLFITSASISGENMVLPIT